jgi:hypothetical protein
MRLLSWMAVLQAVFLLNCGLAVAQQDQTAASYWMPACHDAASSNFYGDSSGEPETVHVFKMGFCAGMINGLIYMERSIGVCEPEGVSSQQATQVVVQYIDKRPERAKRCKRLGRAHGGDLAQQDLLWRRSAPRTELVIAGRQR